MGQPVDITGKRFGKLVALKYSGISNKQTRATLGLHLRLRQHLPG